MTGREQIAAAVGAASAYLSEHPDEARYRDSAAVARVTSGLAVSVTGPGGESVTTDMPKGIGGGSTVPSPGWYFRAAAASCVASLIAIRAAALGLDAVSIEVTVDSESDDRGILGLDDAIPAGALSLKVVARVSGVDDPARRDLVDWAVAHCPVTDSIGRAVPIEIELG